MTIKLTRGRIALIVSVLVAALAGASYAAIPATDGTISACRDQKGTLKVIDAEAGQTCSGSQQPLAWNQQGPTGPEGPPGPAGTARAYAHVGYHGTVHGGNLTAANVVRAGTGRYCFGGLDFEPQAAVVTLGPQSDVPGTPVPMVRLLGGDSEGCPLGYWQMKVVLYQPDPYVADDQEFFVFIN